MADAIRANAPADAAVEQWTAEMTVTFVDLQDGANPMNGAEMDSGATLSAAIDRLMSRPPFLCELSGANGYHLLVGIGPDVGCVQHSAGDGSPPYLMATSSTATIASRS